MTTNQPSINITHSPSPAQLERIFDILDKVFIVGGDYFRDRLLQDIAYQPETTWYATVDENIASSIQIFPLKLRVGNTVLKVGGIGSVGTDPKYRGMGLAQSILNAQCEWMIKNEYDLGLLFAVIHPYYEKLCWKLISESTYMIERPSYQAPSSLYEIIPFSIEYIDQLQAIYEQYNQSRTCTVVRNASYWHDLIKWPEWKKTDCLLLHDGAKIVAYGLIEKSSTERAILYELNYLPEAEHEVISLFTALCNLRSGCTHIQAKLTRDHKLYSYVQSIAATEVPINYTMWKMLNINSLIVKLRSEFEARLLASLFHDDRMNIVLQIGDRNIYLNYSNKTLILSHEEIEQPAHETYYLSFTPEDFICNIINGDKNDEIDTNTLEESLRAILFPLQPSIFYTTDKI